MIKVDKNTVVIEKKDLSVENVPRFRVLLAPKTHSKKDAEEILKPISIDGEKIKPLTKEDFSMKYIVSGKDEENQKDGSDNKETSHETKNERYTHEDKKGGEQ